MTLFFDLIDSLGKVAGGLKAIVNLPKAERETIRRTMAETYRPIGQHAQHGDYSAGGHPAPAHRRRFTA